MSTIEKAQFGAITFDTNIFVSFGLNLEGPYFDELKSLHQTYASFILSEIVIQELQRKLQEQAEKTIHDFYRAIDRLHEQKMIADESANLLDRKSLDVCQPTEAVKRRIEAFKRAMSVNVIPLTDASINAVVDRYFSGEPPFQGRGNKNEFPDAIALLSIESWAMSNQIRVLAISKDKQWKSFASRSEWIHVEENLKKILPQFGSPIDCALDIVVRFVTKAVSGELNDQKKQIISHVHEMLERRSFFLQPGGKYGDSDTNNTLVIVLQYQDLKISTRNSEYDIQVTQFTKNTIQARIGVSIRAWAVDEASLYSDVHLYATGHREFYDTLVEFDSNMDITLGGSLELGTIEGITLIDVRIDDFDEVEILKEIGRSVERM